MCGIVGYTGDREAFPILINGLKKLEYRGYDSAGIALEKEDGIVVYKTEGKVSRLEEMVKDKDLSSRTGIAHTRWATHGVPNAVNAHPHLSASGKLAIVHNGIIENYQVLKEALEQDGIPLKSETDTEILVNFIEKIKNETGKNLFEATQLALKRVVGAYAIVLMDADAPGRLVVARKGSPLVIGLGKNKDYIVASDASPIIAQTKTVYYLDEDEVGLLEPGKEMIIKTLDNKKVNPRLTELDMTIEELEKGGFEYFMLKEIYEQPKSVYDSMRGRIHPGKKIIRLGGIEPYENHILEADRIIMVGCGTSWHAGLVGEYMIEELARIPVEVEYGSEFRYRNPVIRPRDVVIGISQSGETADTLAALKLAKEKGALLLGICNVVGSSIARETHAGIYTHAGPEIGVASTKAFTAQVTVLLLLALRLGYLKGTIPRERYEALIEELAKAPDLIEKVLQTDLQVQQIARHYKDMKNFLYLGRGINFPVALEGALKLKEISYIHAEGYPAAEMKHGPIALIDENMPVVVIATKKGNYDKIVSNIREIKARNGRIIAIVTEGDKQVAALADHTIEIPEADEMLSPLLATIPLQLLAYHIAVMLGRDVDKPRNLAKSVTVE
ncbi:MAG: glutamine--fructose-6-phosphate transaminase (isomerizing) [Chlorobi bacterium]|nr:glutamine--fructose-6-phosphate transaminase (isomerizing) [Chlorobiota bacterium]